MAGRQVEKTKSSYTPKQALRCSVLVCCSIFSCFLCQDQLGPTLLDLQLITGTSLTQASWYSSVMAGGRLIGALLTGLILEGPQQYLKMCIFGVVGGTAFCLIPHMTHYAAAMVMTAVFGVCLGFIVNGDFALVFWIWRGSRNQGVWGFITDLATMTGFALVPLLAVPFMVGETEQRFDDSHGYNMSNISVVDKTVVQMLLQNCSQSWTMRVNHMPLVQKGTMVQVNSTELSGEATDVQDSAHFGCVTVQQTLIWIPYLISGTLLIFTSCLFLVLHLCQCGYQVKKEEQVNSGDSVPWVLTDKCHEGNDNLNKHQSQAVLCTSKKLLKVFIVILVCLAFTSCSVYNITYATFLIPFTHHSLKWSKSLGAWVVLVHGISTVLAKIIYMPLTRRVKVEILIFVNLFTAIVCYVLLVLCIDIWPVIIWPCTVLMAGIGVQLFIPFIIFIEKYIGYSGYVTAIPTACFSMGRLLASPLFGHLLENEMYETFLLVNLGAAVFCFIVSIFMVLAGSKYMSTEADITMQDEVGIR